MKKSVAIICEYVLFPERIGGMDRFFKEYDLTLKNENYNPIWFFKNVTEFDFYKNLNIVSAEDKAVESFFLEYSASNNLKFDVVITHFLQPVSPFFKEIKRRMNSKIINIDHNPRPLDGFSFKKRLKNKIKGLVYGKYIDKLVGVSEYTTKHIIKDFGSHLRNKSTTIYNGIDVSDYKKQELDRKELPTRFLVVSHLRESKGIQDLLLALYKIDKKHHESIIVDVYGDGPYKEELIKLQKEYKLENNVHFKGNSPRLNEFFYKYHYLLQPTYMECFSLSILESLSSNVPVITTTVGGNPEIVEDGINGFLFEPKDILKLSNIIENIVVGKLSVENEVSSKIENEFTLEIMVANHLKLLKCI
ncbi:MAG: group 1 glycosyl transferase [Lutibacter sp.]|nr:MAG: group 1 glycosyl transferase [Lutibacter sp.]